MDALQQLENQRSLAAALGIQDEEAGARLNSELQITWSDGDPASERIGRHVVALLSRTFERVGTPGVPLLDASIELRIQNVASKTTGGQQIHCWVQDYVATIGEIFTETPSVTDPLSPILELLLACFVAARVADKALNLGKCSDAPLILDFGRWLDVEMCDLSRVVQLGRIHIAGAGAVGNAFSYALALLPVDGRLTVIDPKPVTGGVLNRCLCFTAADINAHKAIKLAEWIGCTNPALIADGYVGTIADYRAQQSGEIHCLVSGIDSRSGRRQLQDELPLEVFDASTTGIEEVVFHHNQILADGACLACIYPETPGERDYELHLARKLHVSVTEVRTGYITPAAAGRIVARYPMLSATQITGTAYDSLFKQLCATQQLVGPEQKQVLAPFSFVSQLAGTVMAIEMYLKRAGYKHTEAFNYWRISPWRGPIYDLRTQRPKLDSCSSCSDPIYQLTAREVWT